MVYIHFIINPISGNGKHDLTESFLKKHFPDDRYLIETDFTGYRGHAKELARLAVSLKADFVVACGGDGTINEVASCLIGTNSILGIIPVGSGNGLASNLQIPRDIMKAISIIKKGKTSYIDAGKVNNNYFFSNTGFGIDAMIIKKYEESGKRTLPGYIRASLSSSFDFRPAKALLTFNGQSRTVDPFLLFISNSNEMGYNMSLTPKASLNDGFLDLVIIPKLSFPEKLSLGYYVITNAIHKFRKAEHHRIKSITIELPDTIFTNAQIDGESLNLKTNVLEVSVHEKSLRVLVPAQ